MAQAGGKLKGQVAWISGAASGIGAAIASMFAAEGARVVLADINATAAEQLLDQIKQAGGQGIVSQVDVAREEDVRCSFEATLKEFGAVQVVVNAAGIVQAKLLHECTSEDWSRVMDVNVKSIFYSFKHAWPYMRQHARSYMVNIGSISSFTAQETTPIYAASKGAVLQLSRNIALDYAQYGLRCNCLCPGITDTPMLRTHLNSVPDPEAMLRERLSRVPMGVAMLPEHIARAALFLCCDDSFGITGTSLLIDGGYLSAAECHSPNRTAFMD